MKAFEKNELVTYIADWDRKGTFYFQQAIVRSCGAKRLHLVDASNGANMGRNFAPVVAEAYYTNQHTFKYLTNEEAAAKCIELAEAFLIEEKAQLEKQVALDVSEQHTKCMHEQLEELHEAHSCQRTEWSPE